MCNIMICKNRMPTDSELEGSWRSNYHGAGIGWYKDNKVYYIKGIMSLEELKNKLNELNLTTPFVIHFRLASSGERVPELTHPFIVSPDNKNPLKYCGDYPILFHNGTSSEAVTTYITYCLIKGKKIPKYISDSFCIAKIINRVGFNYLNILSGKFCIVTKNKILHFGNFEEDNGILHSCKPITVRYSFSSSNFNTVNRNCPFIDNNDYSKCEFKSYTQCPYINNKCPKSQHNFED